MTDPGEDRRADRSPGRPRSERAHRAILDATLELLAEEGWSGLTIEGIADRAGVGKATIYRRWDNLQQVLTAAVEEFVSEIVIPDTGSLRSDLLGLMKGAVEVYRGRPGRIMPGLVAAMARHSEVATAVRDGFLAERRRALKAVLDRGIDRGELRRDIDGELLLDFLGGPLFYRLLITGGAIDEELARGTVDMMLRGATPRGPNPQGMSGTRGAGSAESVASGGGS